ncbi:MAG TPA: HNH endonuclease signature motif containing protein, partial [Jiangellales bacterium]|nr:HNH endonuclease signature motif containing protein [Jiangellales bacterium]
HPCCRMPATKSDQDHRIGYATGGATVEANLSAPCRHDHRLKDEGGWAIDRPAPGMTVWTSPLGHRYESRPPPVIADLPEPLPPLDRKQPSPGGRLVWPSRPDPCTCEVQCECRPPILPPSPRRVVTADELVLDPTPAAIFDPDEAPPF